MFRGSLPLPLSLLALSLCLSTPSKAWADSYITYSGTALAARSSKFLYREEDVLLYRGDRIAERVVLYTCRDGSAFARKTVSYVDATAPDFFFVDATNGVEQGVRSAGSTRTVFYGNRAEPEKSVALSPVEGLVADAGFDEFIRFNWDALSTGKSLPINFLIPSRLGFLTFRVRRLRSETVNGIETEVFRLNLSGIGGLILKGIDVYYGSAQHTLVRYDGLSDLRDASLDNFETEIDFPPDLRKPGSREAFEAALEAPLAPCRS